MNYWVPLSAPLPGPLWPPIVHILSEDIDISIKEAASLGETRHLARLSPSHNKKQEK